MKTKAATKAALAALAMSMVATTIPASAQPMSWNRETAWRGAPEGLQQRIDWLQQRIDRGRADGSLSRAEAQRAQRELEMLDRDADALDRRLDNLSRNIRWARGGGGGAHIRHATRPRHTRVVSLLIRHAAPPALPGGDPTQPDRHQRGMTEP